MLLLIPQTLRDIDVVPEEERTKFVVVRLHHMGKEVVGSKGYYPQMVPVRTDGGNIYPLQPKVVWHSCTILANEWSVGYRGFTILGLLDHCGREYSCKDGVFELTFNHPMATIY